MTKIYTILFLIVTLIIGVIFYQQFVGTADNPEIATQQTLVTVPPAQFKTLTESGEYTMIDVRTPQETNEGKIDVIAREIDFYNSNFEDEIAKLDRSDKYLLYCQSGNRSGQTLQIMERLGFTEVYELEGGKNAWDALELYIEPPVQDVLSDVTAENFYGRIVDISAKRFEFDKQTIRVKRGEAVALRVNNEDTIHGINIPNLGQNDNEFLVLDTSSEGEYPFQCSNICGGEHADMKGLLIIEE